MAMMRTGLAGLAAALTVLALAAPGEARAENEDRSNDAQYALNCAIEYAKGASADSSFLERQMALRDRFDLDHENIWLMAMLGDVSDIIPAEWIVDGLAECDRTFGFSPITELIDSRPGIPQTPSVPQITDFDCAVAYRLIAAIRHDVDQDQVQAQNAMQRAEYALRLHLTANPELDPNSLGPQVNGLARTRGEQIQQDQESGEALFNDINACEAKYGFAQAGGQ
ncbi:hypothetical protein [Maritimibacter fusiformis]|uniref:Uncharacterized protein n=1 Tax=Maritimibacter fusiformis TaxID=2603819 RepID=A0A5D0RJ13_9RHOB|nr:hypothetical protein [Maritimibacter fusiformis]TYB80795.1 hypothetical protein FVF75_12150 [Maritimibacter fusiformis]